MSYDDDKKAGFKNNWHFLTLSRTRFRQLQVVSEAYVLKLGPFRKMLPLCKFVLFTSLAIKPFKT